MISFIVIGRNEGWKLTKCLNSIFDCIKHNSIENYEVLFVDSNSTDDSRERAAEFKKVDVYNLVADCNAAIARNTGFKNSKGSVLFFIDGDMEIKKEFLPLVYSEQEGLIDEFVSGNWTNVFYDKDENFLNNENFLNMTEDRREFTTGGLFLIKRQAWNRVNGMRNMFKKSQDIDLGLRLSEENTLLLRKKDIAAKHHTIAYHNKNRIWKELSNGKHLYGRSLLYREHWLNKNIYKRIIRNEYSLITLIACILISLLTGFFQYVLIYLVLILVRSKFRPNISLYYFLRDMQVLFGLFFFYPKRTFNVQVNQFHQ